MQEVRLCKGTQDSRHLTEVTILANLGRNPAHFFQEAKRRSMAGVDAGTSETASKIAHAMKRHKKAGLSPCQKLLLLVGGMIVLCVALYALSVLRPGERRDAGQTPRVCKRATAQRYVCELTTSSRLCASVRVVT